jgi:hypothetical protein
VSKHLPREVREKRFVDKIVETVRRGGRVLLPIVALGRAQVRQQEGLGRGAVERKRQQSNQWATGGAAEGGLGREGVQVTGQHHLAIGSGGGVSGGRHFFLFYFCGMELGGEVAELGAVRR